MKQETNTSPMGSFDFRNIEDVMNEAPIAEVSPKSRGNNNLPTELVNDIVNHLPFSKKLAPVKTFVAIILLMLKGAASFL